MNPNEMPAADPQLPPSGKSKMPLQTGRPKAPARIFPPRRDYASVSIKDLLDAREALPRSPFRIGERRRNCDRTLSHQSKRLVCFESARLSEAEGCTDGERAQNAHQFHRSPLVLASRVGLCK